MGTNKNQSEALNRARGCLLGLAAGDALGTTLEFQAPGSFQPIDDMIGGGPFGLKPGEWTDDTSMALCLAESLNACRGFDARDQMQRYVRWCNEGHLSSIGRCFDIGNTVRGALRQFEADKDPYAGSTDPRSAGNGSLMRLAPIPIYYSNDVELAVRLAVDSSRTTHAAPTCIDACRFYTALIHGALQGRAKEELLDAGFTAPLWKKDPLCPEIAEIAAGSYKRKNPPEIRGTGYVVQSLEAALWAFHHAGDFRQGALLAVNLGDDADTTGAIYGQLAGAYGGLAGIPSLWLDKLALRPMMEQFVEGLTLRGQAPSAELVDFIDEQQWIFAKTYADTWPHEYLLQDRVDASKFQTLSHHIRTQGTPGPFYGQSYIYFEHAGHLYWAMGDPLEESSIINRCLVESSYEARKAAGTLPARS